MADEQQGKNEYEQAFEAWLRDEAVGFARVEQTHRCVLKAGKTKTFDYILHPREGVCVLVELKGRIFQGRTLEGRKGLQCWVLSEDAAALDQWRMRFSAERTGVEAVFVFAYRLEKIAVDEDGLAVYDDGRRRYVFLAIRLADYRRCMKRRSVRWKTVTLSAADFRRHSFPAEQIWNRWRAIDGYDNTNFGTEDSGRRPVDGCAGRAVVEGLGGAFG